jgi:hypothetical protein
LEDATDVDFQLETEEEDELSVLVLGVIYVCTFSQAHPEQHLTYLATINGRILHLQSDSSQRGCQYRVWGGVLV